MPACHYQQRRPARNRSGDQNPARNTDQDR